MSCPPCSSSSRGIIPANPPRNGPSVSCVRSNRAPMQNRVVAVAIRSVMGECGVNSGSHEIRYHPSEPWRGVGRLEKKRVLSRIADALGTWGRAIAHAEAVLTTRMWLVGCVYNFCWLHQSLHVTAPTGASWKWQERTPAMASGLTHHRWTMRELLHYQVPPPAWVAPNRRDHPSIRALQPAMAPAA